jgi:macrolide transport system ATP-binding/permease protein
MLIAQMSNILKSYGDRQLLHIDNLKIYKGDKIGLVGANGSGKTTLLNILAGRDEPDTGTAQIFGPFSFIAQLDDPESMRPTEAMSGGELTRLKISKALLHPGVLLIADEPTSNLDAKGIEKLEHEFVGLDCALLLVSHDRAFLDMVCNRIIDLESGEIHLYRSNYTAYRQQKELEKQREGFEYEQYIAEKRRIEKAVQSTALQAKKMKNTPKRMGNSEARLHKLGNQKAQKAVQKTTDALHSRLKLLEVKYRPVGQPEIQIALHDGEQTGAKTILQAFHLSKSFGSHKIFEDTSFIIKNKTKTVVLGPNGCGKTTFLDMLLTDPAVTRAPGVNPGYFRQDLNLLNNDRTLLENVTDAGRFDETHARTLLAQMDLNAEDISKPAGVLSGGERVKASLCRIISGGFNLLILDEPTNYLDIASVEALEKALRQYDGTLVFVTHDRRFAKNIADHILCVENHKLVSFDGGFDQWVAKKAAAPDDTKTENRRLVLENRLAFLTAHLSMPSDKTALAAMDEEYRMILSQLKDL